MSGPKHLNAQKELALGFCRALDLTDEKGFLCGRILGDLGADVIKVEQPGGDSSRRIGPFYHDSPHAERSLYWFVYNSNKRGITLSLETTDGRELFKKLVRTADFVIESAPPGYMEATGLGYPVLSQINPGIIMTSISHFGQAGPYRDFKGSDMVDMAMSGYMYICGDRDRPPVRISLPQAYAHAGGEAATGSMIAFYHRQVTGEGQWVDVSIRDSLVKVTWNLNRFWEYIGRVQRREGCFLERVGAAGPVLSRQTWPCKDGAVSTAVLGGGGGIANSNRALAQWMAEEGMADDFLKSIDWETLDMARMTQETSDRIGDQIARFLMRHTTAELYDEAKKRRIMLYPVSSPEDLAGNQHLAARGFWQQVEHPELNASITYPGAPAKATETPYRIRRCAPLIGEHNEQVYGEMGISGEQLLTLRQANII